VPLTGNGQYSDGKGGGVYPIGFVSTTVFRKLLLETVVRSSCGRHQNTPSLPHG
jgi:hypothetical protein